MGSDAGSVEPACLSVIIVVCGDPTAEIGESDRVQFMMQGHLTHCAAINPVTRFDNGPPDPVS